MTKATTRSAECVCVHPGCTWRAYRHGQTERVLQSANQAVAWHQTRNPGHKVHVTRTTLVISDPTLTRGVEAA